MMSEDKHGNVIIESDRPDNNISSSHYDVGGLSVQQIWESKMTYQEVKGLYKGNILKYVLRADHKGGINDYRKAMQYLQFLIDLEEKEAKG